VTDLPPSCPTCGATGGGDLRSNLQRLVGCIDCPIRPGERSACEAVRTAVLAHLELRFGHEAVGSAWAEALRRAG